MKQVSCKILTNHFTKGVCSEADFNVQIIEKLPGNGRKGKYLDPKSTKYRKERELHWMLKLRTVYPYGLNDRVGDEFKIERNQKLVAKRFPRLDKQYIPKSKGNRQNTTKTCEEFSQV